MERTFVISQTNSATWEMEVKNGEWKVEGELGKLHLTGTTYHKTRIM